FSLFEEHTDIIIKGRRDVDFGHKFYVATGASQLVLDMKVLDGNPADCEVLYSTGMRRMELLALRIHDVDDERGTVFVQQGKGKKDRMVPLANMPCIGLSATSSRFGLIGSLRLGSKRCS
ncbi:MAG: tyrosine-type recombinase/integrase, partial [Deltaproteobacteria bacterium]|nr:tyrosine-type recombinase/integrase [Deltaproteobacteria bacterium]